MKQSFNSVLATPDTEAAASGVQCEKLFLEISQNTCTRVSSLIKLQTRPATLLKKRPWHVFSCEFCEISNDTFLTEHLWVNACTDKIVIKKAHNIVKTKSTRKSQVSPKKIVLNGN